MSIKNGKTWKTTAPDLKSANVYAVAIDPTEASKLAAGGWDTGIYTSNDSGVTWSKASGTLTSPNITSVVYDQNVDHRLWASTFEEGTFYSDDGGANWTNANIDGAYVFDLGFLPKGLNL